MGFPRGRTALWVGFLVLALAVALSACAARSRASGVVTSVDGSFADVTSFTLRTSDGDDLTFTLDESGDFAFPPGHLREHLIAGSPIVVEWVEEDGELRAIFIDDDADASPHRLSG